MLKSLLGREVFQSTTTLCQLHHLYWKLLLSMIAAGYGAAVTSVL
jgi:hypothetical protein